MPELSDPDQARADRMERATDAIMAALKEIAGNDMQVAIGALGVALGCVARASGSPAAVMAKALEVAQGVIDGGLLEARH